MDNFHDTKTQLRDNVLTEFTNSILLKESRNTMFEKLLMVEIRSCSSVRH